jgi:hypothetical protein
MEHDEVHDHRSFAQYVMQLRVELDDPCRQSDWENVDLQGFLNAMAAWAIDYDKPADGNPWRHAAGVLAAASVYE